MPSNRARKKRQLRILHIISSSAASGAEKHLVDSACGMAAKGHRVDVVCPKGGWLPEELRKSGIEVHEMGLKKWSIPSSIVRVACLIWFKKIDLIHTHLSRASYFGLVCGTATFRPVAASVHVVNSDPIYLRLARGRNRLVAVSEFVKWYLQIRGVPTENIVVVYNGTDFLDREAVVPEPFRSKLGIPDGRRLFALVGRVCEQKGHFLIVEAMSAVLTACPDAQVLFLGRCDPETRAALDARIVDLGIADSVTFAGEVEEVASIMDCVEFTVVPSEIEAFGIVAIESMARGKPVIASRRGALTEIVETRVNGLIVDLSVEAFANAIVDLLQDREKTLRYGEAAKRSIAERFTVGRTTEALENVYGSMLRFE